jgi:NAD(P)-dependent dehydrogenase (short-subunit alcohol dehydrogenase family)
MGVYSMTKAAINSLTKSLALELYDDEIRVNAIAPGVIRTKFAKVLVDNIEATGSNEFAIGDAKDVADLAYFLASSESKMINGNIIEITGKPMPSL